MNVCIYKHMNVCAYTHVCMCIQNRYACTYKHTYHANISPDVINESDVVDAVKIQSAHQVHYVETVIAGAMLPVLCVCTGVCVHVCVCMCTGGYVDVCYINMWVRVFAIVLLFELHLHILHIYMFYLYINKNLNIIIILIELN